jgi:hypothetical protein
MGGTFSVEPIHGYGDSFVSVMRYEKELQQKTAALRERLNSVVMELERLERSEKALYKKTVAHQNNFDGLDNKRARFDKEGGGEYFSALLNLRKEKKEVMAEISGVTTAFYAAKPEKYVVAYRDMLVADTFSNVAELIPKLRDVKQERLWRMPIFTWNTGKMRGKDMSNVGVVGGPCLFGTDDMIVEVTHSDGARFLFDFNTSQNCGDGSKIDMSEHLLKYGGEITDVSFDNRKTRMTLHDYESLAYPMEIASVLGAPLVFPVPDMSYRKYLEAVTENFKEDLRRDTLEKFKAETEKIADLHIELFYSLLKTYPIDRYIVLHERDSSVMDFFYESREIYFKCSGFAGRRDSFSAKAGKNESVYDYISVLAAPYYFFNTESILQCDRVDEVCTMLKCAKAHKNKFILFGIMYPEILCRNGTDTIFNAPREQKIYYNE